MHLGAACTFSMCVPRSNSKGAPCSLFICLLELNWFKQLSRGRQTKGSYKAEKAALGAGQCVISEKQGKRTLAGKEKVCIHPKYFVTLWSFVFCWLLGYHVCPGLMLQHQHLVASIQYILINIHWPQTDARVAVHSVSCAYQKACLFLVWLCQEAVTATRSDICVRHCTVYVYSLQAIWRTKGAVAVFTQNLCEIAWLSQKYHTQSCQVVFKVLGFAQLLINRFHKREEASYDAEQCIENMDKSFFSVKEAVFHKSKIIISTSKWQFEVNRKTWTIWRQTC